MKQIRFIHLLFVLLALALSACYPSQRETTPATLMPTLQLELLGTKEPPKVVAETGTVTPTRPTETPEPVASYPVLITQGTTNVRLGPGTIFGVSHILSANSIVPIIGKNLNSTWWVVPGPGDGAGPHGWVSNAVVIVKGDTSNVSFMAAPTLTPTPTLPTMGNSGSPPGGNTCVITHAGPGDTGPTHLHQGPGDSFAVAAVLGLNRWANIVEVQNDWYHIQDSAGISGWVHQSRVAFSGQCSAPGSGPDNLPLVENPGSPPSDRCLASRPGQFPPPGIYLGPGHHFALTARLGNWAEIVNSEIGWHQILIGPGQVGWVDDADVELTGTCPTPEPVPQRIQFEPGAISAIVDGALQPPQRDRYLFRALAGQHTIVEIHSTEGRANFMINGVNDGQPYKRLEDERRLWGAELPVTQDYLLTVAAPAQAPFTEYSIELLIEPLDNEPPPAIGMEIENFVATAVDLPDNGKQITFNWETSGGATARILSGTAQRFQPVWEVSLSGELTVDVPQTLFRDPAMTLELHNEAGEFIAESVVVDWDCTNSYFFTPEPRRCPHPVTPVPAAAQSFEHGLMVWLDNVAGDGRRLIVVLYDDGSLQTFTDIWQEGDPIDDPALKPPPELFQPVRGFGQVWREQPGVRDRLGWATNQEQGFQAPFQVEMVESIPILGYLQLLDGRILYLPLDVPLGTWEQIN